MGLHSIWIMHQSQWPRDLRRRSWLLGWWDHGFKYCLRHVCLSLSFCVVLSCVGRGLVTGWSLIQSSPTEGLRNTLRNLPCEAAKALTRTVEPLMNECIKCMLLLPKFNQVEMHWQILVKFPKLYLMKICSLVLELLHLYGWMDGCDFSRHSAELQMHLIKQICMFY
jgi:hypothetical protein